MNPQLRRSSLMFIEVFKNPLPRGSAFDVHVHIICITHETMTTRLKLAIQIVKKTAVLALRGVRGRPVRLPREMCKRPGLPPSIPPGRHSEAR